MVRPTTALAFAALLWVTVLVATTSPAAHQPGRIRTVMRTAVYAVGAVICHQRPERSFEIWHSQMPVCARCTGIYLGAALVAVLLLAAPPRQPLSPRQARW